MEIKITRKSVARGLAAFVNGYTRGFSQTAAPTIAAAGAVYFWQKGKKGLAAIYAATCISCIARQVVGVERDIQGDEEYEDWIAEKLEGGSADTKTTD